MKLEGNNKYNKYKIIGMSALLSGAILLSGCGFRAKTAEIIESTNAPIITAAPTPVITNTPEPTTRPTLRPTVTPKPTAMPMVELEGEELENAIKELCILNPKEKNSLGLYSICIFETAYGEKKVMITYCAVFGDRKDMHVYDIFTDEELFTFYDPTEYGTAEYPTVDLKINPYFIGCSIRTVNVVPMLINYADYLNIGFDMELADKFFPQSGNLIELKYTVRHMAEMYVNLIPECLRVKAADLDAKYAISPTPAA